MPTPRCQTPLAGPQCEMRWWGGGREGEIEREWSAISQSIADTLCGCLMCAGTNGAVGSAMAADRRDRRERAAVRMCDYQGCNCPFPFLVVLTRELCRTLETLAWCSGWLRIWCQDVNYVATRLHVGGKGLVRLLQGFRKGLGGSSTVHHPKASQFSQQNGRLLPLPRSKYACTNTLINNHTTK